MNKVTVPITIGFDESRVVGKATLDLDQLPAEPDFHFGLSFIVDEMEWDEDPTLRRINKITLLSISLVHDENFMPLKKML